MITDLGTDVLLDIFSLADVSTILTLSQVNRLFNGAAFAKQLWILILRRCSPGSGLWNKTLDKVTTETLIEEVRRAVHGPRTWSCRTHGPPKLIRQSTIQLKDSKYYKFLPGGTHILNYRGKALDCGISRMIECLEVESGRQAWALERLGCGIADVALDLSRGVCNVMVALTFGTPLIAFNVELLIIEANLSTGQSIERLHLPLGSVFPSRQQFLGDFYLCTLHQFDEPADSNFLLVMNWRAEEFVLFKINLLDPIEIKIYPFTAFKRFWLPLNQFDLSSHTLWVWFPCACIPVAEHGILTPSVGHDVKLAITASILHQHTYDLAVSVTELVQPQIKGLSSLWRRAVYTPRTAVTRYRIILPDEPGPAQIVPKSVVRHSRGLSSASDAGYGLADKGGRFFVYPLHQWEVKAPKQLPLPLPTGAQVALAPCGAIVVNEGGGLIKIFHYQ
ncbi:hypothetical protein DFH06DRAFT_1334363 [Mycena polygramma]|nr:hypothetical protein DFH06DRAFT_1334363 [Mycena polygramma]